MQYLRTDETRFDNLPEYPFESHYENVPDQEGGTLRMHYLDEGEGDVILCLHGQPTWSYLYRKMIPIFVDAGYRVVTPDFIGFGKSDKPTARDNYTYANHVAWLKTLIEHLNLSDITLVCQDWGGLIGLRTAAENPDRFARIVTANTGLPDAKDVKDEAIAEVSDRMRAYYETLPVAGSAIEMATAMSTDNSGMQFLHWVKFTAESEGFDQIADVVNMSCAFGLSSDEQRAYNAPFPDDAHKAGARQFPSLVPIMPDNPAVQPNRAAWAVFEQWQKPFLTAFSDSDPITAGGDLRFQQSIPGAQNQPHITIKGAGHFLQEQAPAELAGATLKLIADNPLS